MYNRMINAGIVPDIVSLNILLNSFCGIDRIALGFAVFGGIQKKGYAPDTFTYTSLIKGLGVADKVVEAQRLFD